MDRQWKGVSPNGAAPRLFNCFIDMAARTGPRNMLHLMFDPAGLRPHVAEWERVALSLIQRVYRETLGHHLDGKTQALLDSLLAYPDVPPEWRTPKSLSAEVTSPVIPIGLIKNGQVLRYFSLVTTVGTP